MAADKVTAGRKGKISAPKIGMTINHAVIIEYKLNAWNYAGGGSFQEEHRS